MKKTTHEGVKWKELCSVSWLVKWEGNHFKVFLRAVKNKEFLLIFIRKLHHQNLLPKLKIFLCEINFFMWNLLKRLLIVKSRIYIEWVRERVRKVKKRENVKTVIDWHLNDAKKFQFFSHAEHTNLQQKQWMALREIELEIMIRKLIRKWTKNFCFLLQ